MKSMDNLLHALEECGEAAAFCKSGKVVAANEHFAELFDKDREECADLPIIELCHENSIEMICDFIKRRTRGAADIPRAYSASFRNDNVSRMDLEVTVLETENTEGAYLTILGRADED